MRRKKSATPLNSPFITAWRKMRAASRKAGRMGARNCGSVERRPADPA